MPAPTAAFLPSPRLPYYSSDPTAAELRSGLPADAATDAMLAPLVEYERHFRDASLASAELEDSRPGGTVWGEALQADAAAALQGDEPKAYATERLLAGDARRWARASARARVLAERRRIMRSALPLADISAAALVHQDAAVQRCHDHAREGWQNRTTLSTAWREYELARAASSEATRAYRVAAWARGGQWQRTPTGGWPAADLPPASAPAAEQERARLYRRAGGYGHALHAALHPSERMLMLPQRVEWPADSDVMLNRVSVVGAKGADLRDKGWSDAAPTPVR
jgi:hypothetical protein